MEKLLQEMNGENSRGLRDTPRKKRVVAVVVVVVVVETWRLGPLEKGFPSKR